jgi:hypothetical protein
MPFGPMYILPIIQRAALATVTWLLHATRVLIIVVLLNLSQSLRLRGAR